VERSRGAPLVIRPASVGEVLDVGVRLARRNYWPLVLLAAWGLVPWYVLEAIVSAAGGTGQPQVAASIAQHPLLILGYVLFFLASVVIVGLSFLAVLLACAQLVTGEAVAGNLDAGALYRLALGRLGAYVLLLILFVILALPLTILFPLGIFLLVRWSVSIVALAVERKGPLASLRRSWQLTRGPWWHILGTFIVWWILLLVLEFVLAGLAGAAGSVLTLAGHPVVGSLVSSIASLILALLVTPISLAIYVVLYYELRARREGFDLALHAPPAPNA
jgi:hypothetical protein